VDAGHYPIIERRRGITGAAGIMRAAAREVASLQQQSDVRKQRRYLYNIFYSSTLSSLHLRIKMPN
jgi:hypothetical protein